MRSILCIIPVGFLRWLFVLAGWDPGARRIAKVKDSTNVYSSTCSTCSTSLTEFNMCQPISTLFCGVPRCGNFVLHEVTEILNRSHWSSYVKLFAPHCSTILRDGRSPCPLSRYGTLAVLSEGKPAGRNFCEGVGCSEVQKSSGHRNHRITCG